MSPLLTPMLAHHLDSSPLPLPSMSAFPEVSRFQIAEHQPSADGPTIHDAICYSWRKLPPNPLRTAATSEHLRKDLQAWVIWNSKNFEGVGREGGGVEEKKNIGSKESGRARHQIIKPA